jgi:predicted AAA+ superfamily ATPase
MINRILEQSIKSHFFKGKAIIILGARQVGKTTLLKKIMSDFVSESIYLNADEPEVRDRLTNTNSLKIKGVIGPKKVVLIDEAQRVKNIGLTLKLFVDNYPDIQVIASGSSAFELASEINEPLTGRKYEYLMFPLSMKELSDNNSVLAEQQMLEHRLVYGCYPEIVMNSGEERENLKNLCSSYLYKDILALKEIRKPEILERLLTGLALQIGSEVSFNELALYAGIDKDTVAKYINILEKAYIIFRLPSFSRNLRNEVKKNRKIYFYDNGIRNALISNYSELNLRTDKGALWENYLVSERLKYNNYQLRYPRSYFWRTVQQQEIDYIEDYDGQISAFEFKWKEKKYKIPGPFKQAYPGADHTMITTENYDHFLGME